MPISLFLLLLSAVLLTNPTSPALPSAHGQDGRFATKIVNLTLSEISETGPNAEIALGVNEDAATVEEISRHYPALNDQLDYVAQGLKDSLVALKYDLINRLKDHEEGKHSAGDDDLLTWLKRTKAYYESLLSAH